MKLVSKTFAGILLAALSFCAFAQAPAGTGAAAPAAPAQPDPDEVTPFDAASAAVEEMCSNLKIAGTPESVAKAKKALGKFLVLCVKHGTGAPAPAAKPAAAAAGTGAEAFKAMGDRLAAAERALQASATEAASCPTGSRHIFQASNGTFNVFCKGQKDEVYLPPAPVVVQQVAPAAEAAIVHGGGAGAARAVTGATPAAQPQVAMGSQGFQPCVLRSNGKATLRSSGKLLAINEVIATIPLLQAAEMFPNLKTTAEICSAWSNKTSSDLTVTTTQ